MNFVINFGNLNADEEKQYIKAILNKGLDKFSDQIIDFNEFINFATNCISQCHNFIRIIRDISAVSLREINRINIFFDFFYYYLKEKTKYKQDYVNKSYLLKCALNLSIYSCYYLRISDNKEREFLLKILDKDFENEFLKIPLKEVQFITDQFVIDKQKNIILNKSLRENLFSGFICIINKIPLIIVGKPGESKSLSIQILMKSMKGIYSKNDFFQKYPSIIKFDYQGSITSTSNGIIETFNKARHYYRCQKMKRLNKKTNEDLIVLLFFDELGLAERSPNNPLKAIHAELEYSENEDKIAFIGISNWIIDASKMNRCNILSKQIYLDEKELIDTALLLYKNICSFNKSKFIESLAKAYNDFLKDDQSNFYGARDFYHLIKNVSKELLKIENKKNFSNDELIKIGLKAICRNFGGDEDKLKDFIKGFEDKFCYDKNSINIFKNDEYNILDCINDNIKDYDNRYLMLIIENLTTINALENRILKKYKNYKNYYILQGSKFNLEKNSENEIELIENLLKLIRYYMTKDFILILKDLELIYPSLYELFNQNYMKYGDKYYTKIAFSNTKVTSEINQKLRIILLVTQNQINQKVIDIPLLNRFEKQKIKFNEIIYDFRKNGNIMIKYNSLYENIINKLNKIATFNKKNKEKELKFNLSRLIIFTESQIRYMINEIIKSFSKNNNKPLKEG